MDKIYVVVENGELYTNVYSTYESSCNAVTTKYNTELTLEQECIKEAKNPAIQMASYVDENDTGTTKLYIEKDIHIIIQQYYIPK